MFPKLEYAAVFTSMPVLFEYVLELLQKKPEVLERNDAEVFKRDTEHVKNNDQDKFTAKMEKLMELVEFKMMNNKNQSAQDM